MSTELNKQDMSFPFLNNKTEKNWELIHRYNYIKSFIHAGHLWFLVGHPVAGGSLGGVLWWFFNVVSMGITGVVGFTVILALRWRQSMINILRFPSSFSTYCWCGLAPTTMPDLFHCPVTASWNITCLPMPSWGNCQDSSPCARSICLGLSYAQL